MNEKIENAKRRIKRLLISKNDILEVVDFVNQLLKHELYYPDLLSWFDEFVETDHYINHRALTSALIVAYARPFSDNKSSISATSILSPKSLRDFTQKELKLHNEIIQYRNQIYAHSEGEVWDAKLSGLDESKYIGASYVDPYISFDEEELRSLLEMCDHIISFIDDSIDSIIHHHEENLEYLISKVSKD